MRAEQANLSGFSNAVRRATLADVPYMDSLQRKFSHALGFWPTAWLQKSIIVGNVWLALENGDPAGYLLGRATYKDRLDCGIIYQACIQYDAQHRELGWAVVNAYLGGLPDSTKATLLWCASDLDANNFWEAMGFTPLGWRYGSKRQGRIHVLWEGQIERTGGLATPYIPATTDGGLLRGRRDVHIFRPGEDWHAIPAYDLAAALAEENAPRAATSANPASSTPRPRRERPPLAPRDRLKGLARAVAMFDAKVGERRTIRFGTKAAAIPQLFVRGGDKVPGAAVELPHSPLISWPPQTSEEACSAVFTITSSTSTTP